MVNYIAIDYTHCNQGLEGWIRVDVQLSIWSPWYTKPETISAHALKEVEAQHTCINLMMRKYNNNENATYTYAYVCMITVNMLLLYCTQYLSHQ